MIDIIDQLRERTENIDVIFEAADEIESLRSELEQAKVDKVALQKVAFTAQEMAKEIAADCDAKDARIASLKTRLKWRDDEIQALSKRVGELEATLEHNNSALDGANAIIARLEADARAENEALRKHVEQLQAKLHCMCGSEVNHSAYEGHSPVSMYDYALDQEKASCDRLRSAYDDVRALNAQLAVNHADIVTPLRVELAEAKSALSAMTADRDEWKRCYPGAYQLPASHPWRSP